LYSESIDLTSYYEPETSAGFDDGQDAAPLDEPRQGDEYDPSRTIGATWLHLPLHVQRQLLPQEQILRGDSTMRPHGGPNKPDTVGEDLQERPSGGARL
jgi:hypothetical protein